MRLGISCHKTFVVTKKSKSTTHLVHVCHISAANIISYFHSQANPDILATTGDGLRVWQLENSDEVQTIGQDEITLGRGGTVRPTSQTLVQKTFLANARAKPGVFLFIAQGKRTSPDYIVRIQNKSMHH
jgi:hypothetical protein